MATGSLSALLYSCPADACRPLGRVMGLSVGRAEPHGMQLILRFMLRTLSAGRDQPYSCCPLRLPGVLAELLFRIRPGAHWFRSSLPSSPVPQSRRRPGWDPPLGMMVAAPAAPAARTDEASTAGDHRMTASSAAPPASTPRTALSTAGPASANRGGSEELGGRRDAVGQEHRKATAEANPAPRASATIGSAERHRGPIIR